MTTIAALARDGVVYMAADTMVNVYDRPINNGARKIRRQKAGDGEVLIACTGDGGLSGVLERDLVIHDEPEGDDPQRWADAVAVEVTQKAVAVGLVEEGRLDGLVLLGWRGKLWTICHAQAIPHPDGIAALGSGEGPAIGAMDVMLAHNDHVAYPYAQIVAAAVRIAVHRDRFSAEPIQLEVLPGATD